MSDVVSMVVIGFGVLIGVMWVAGILHGLLTGQALYEGQPASEKIAAFVVLGVVAVILIAVVRMML